MQKRSVIIIVLLLALSFTCGIAARNWGHVDNSNSTNYLPGGGALVAAGGGAPSIDLRPVETLYSVLRNLREYYVEPIKTSEESEMARGAVRSMLSSLDDPNSRFLEPRERKLISDSQQGLFHGIGSITTVKRIKSGQINEEHLVIVSNFPNSPAEMAGLEPGDDVISVDGRSVLPFNPYARASSMVDKARKEKSDRGALRKVLETEQGRIDRGIPIIEAQGLLSGYDEKNLEVTVNRVGTKKPISFTVKPGKLYVEPVAYTAPDANKLAVIKVNLLVNATQKAFEKAMMDAADSGAKGLVLDLRGVAGGDRTAAQFVAGFFIPGKRIGILNLSRGRSETIKADTAPEKYVWTKPVTILVDGRTGRFAELMADTLRYQKGYKLVGEKTIGDSVYSTMVDLADGSAYVITTGKLTPISGIDFTKKGFPVDVRCAQDKSGDAQLSQALEVLNAEPGGI